jgi:hypothetical protein
MQQASVWLSQTGTPRCYKELSSKHFSNLVLPPTEGSYWYVVAQLTLGRTKEKELQVQSVGVLAELPIVMTETITQASVAAQQPPFSALAAAAADAATTLAMSQLHQQQQQMPLTPPHIASLLVLIACCCPHPSCSCWCPSCSG